METPFLLLQLSLILAILKDKNSVNSEDCVVHIINQEVTGKKEPIQKIPAYLSPVILF